MFHLSECTIEFYDSRAYCRLMWTLHVMAICLLANSGLPGWAKGLLISGMLVESLRVYRFPKPYPAFERLHIREGACILMLKNQAVVQYTHCRVLVNCGLFFLLELSAQDATRVLVIFFDHIELDCYRTICFLEKIQ